MGNPVDEKTSLSRRGFLGKSCTAGSAALVGALAGCATSPPPPRGTTSKAEAQYTDRASGLTHCGICHHFYSPDICEIVAGPVSPDGWCKFYSLL